MISRFSPRTLADHVRRYPSMAFVADEGRQYVVAGPWRRRSDVAELIEVSRGGLRASLLATVDTALAAQGVRLLVLDQGAHPVDRELCREAGF
ncbi:MAG TPA: hypothetical protein VNL16_20070, partial [Chloroflexota bacterium]|nr:hypothetical protein [Chloroflexota bacterium]